MYVCDVFMNIEVTYKICVTSTIVLVQYILIYLSQMQRVPKSWYNVVTCALKWSIL